MTPLLAHTRNVIFLEDGDIGTLTPLSMTVTGAEGQPAHREMVQIDWNAEAVEKGGYPHFMLKEIHEQPQAILDTLRGRFSYDSGEADLPDLAITPDQLRNARSMWIVACGTSWHSGLVGKYLFEETRSPPGQVDIGSEFRYRNPMVQEGDVFIALSQSGETADTLAAAREAKRLARTSCRL